MSFVKDFIQGFKTSYRRAKHGLPANFQFVNNENPDGSFEVCPTLNGRKLNMGSDWSPWTFNTLEEATAAAEKSMPFVRTQAASTGLMGHISYKIEQR